MGAPIAVAERPAPVSSEKYGTHLSGSARRSAEGGARDATGRLATWSRAPAMVAARMIQIRSRKLVKEGGLMRTGPFAISTIVAASSGQHAPDRPPGHRDYAAPPRRSSH